MARQNNRADPMDRLADIIGGLQRPDRFKLGKFDGSGDVELFLQDFDAVREANHWSDAASLLHLRASLCETAADCKRGRDIDQVRNRLRLRFGITPAQARDRLVGMRRETGQSLHALASEVERLVGIGFAEIPAQAQASFTIDAFKKALDHTGVQQHLLAVPTDTLEATVRAADEYLSLNKKSARGHKVNNVSEQSPTSLIAILQSIEETQLHILNRLATEDNKRGSSSRATIEVRECFNCGSKDQSACENPAAGNQHTQQGNE